MLKITFTASLLTGAPYTITQYVDHIAVVDDGCIKESGTREHLLNQTDSVYAKFYKAPNGADKSSEIVVSPCIPPPSPVIRNRNSSNKVTIVEESRAPKDIMDGYDDSLNCSVGQKNPIYELWKRSKPKVSYLIVGMVAGIITGVLAPA